MLMIRGWDLFSDAGVIYNEVLEQKSTIEACGSREGHGVGSMGQLKGPDKNQGQSPW